MKPLLSLCTVPAVATKDGNTGAFAKLLLPFYGYWFASGAHYTWPNATMAQDGSATIHGLQMADTFQKSCCDCLGH